MNFYKGYIKNHFSLFCLAAAIWIPGIFLGIIAALTADGDAATGIDSYIQSILNSHSGFLSVLSGGIANNFRYSLSLCIASSFAIFLPLTWVLIAFKGFSTGFAASFIIRLYGLGGVAATVTAVVLPLFVSLPVFFVMYVSCMDFPISAYRLRREITSAERWKMYLSHLAKMLVLFMILNLITSIEALLSPKLFGVLKK